jgi:hypothetical protein
MVKWKYLSLGSVIAAGVLGFLRVVANEILAVEKKLRLVEAEEKARRDRAKKWEEAA